MQTRNAYPSGSDLLAVVGWARRQMLAHKRDRFARFVPGRGDAYYIGVRANAMRPVALPGARR
jgi:hypothetical protein